MKKVIKEMIILVIGFSIIFAICFGFNALVVWAICKIMGWTFAWKWVVLFTMCYSLLSGLFKCAQSKN